MSPKEKRKVRLRIVNPLTAESKRFISLYHLERYIRRHQAYVNGAGEVCFTCNSVDRIISAEQQLRINTRRGYDTEAWTGLATLPQLKGVPVTGDPRRVYYL